MNDMLDLINKLNYYRNEYYNNNKSIISDKEYDDLFDKLTELEKRTGIKYANSPTATVGYDVVSKLEKVQHNHPLLSLDKTTDISDFANYFMNKKSIIMAKMDGLTCSLTYRNGKLIMAESRGNGFEGENITHNALTISNLPKEIPFNGEIIIDGECIINYKSFTEINEPLISKAKQEAQEMKLNDVETVRYIHSKSYANPRNLASGSVRQLDSKIAATRKIEFIAWKLHSVDSEFEIQLNNSHENAFKFLKTLGFTVVPYEIVNDYSNIKTTIDKIKKESENLFYPIDGIVGMFDDIKYGIELGSTSHHPKHSLAFKFYQDDNYTNLIDIEWNVSRTGLVNPVAILEPVEIDGTIVSRATLSNVSIIKELKLGIGDKINVIKSHQIIPKIVENISKSNTYVIPHICPSCGKELIIKNDNGREMLYCTNPSCFDKLHDKISNFVSREAINISGLSDERIRTFMLNGYISDFQSIYKLKDYEQELKEINGFGKQSVESLLTAIEESKKCDMSNIIVAIGIPNIGKSAAKTISEYCANKIKNDYDNIFEIFIELAKQNFDWSILPEIGDTTSIAINSYVIDNLEEISPLKDIFICSIKSSMPTTDKLNGKTFCITGKLVEFKNRDSLIASIENNGGKIVSGVSNKTNYLITNDKNSGSSKNKSAQKYGTVIISEQEYLEMIE